MIARNAAARSLAPLLWVLACWLPLPAQVDYTRRNQDLTPSEQETVDFNRKLAVPSKPTPRAPLSPGETARVRTFRRSRNSVVFIHSITHGQIENQRGDQYAIPPASGTGFVWDDLGHVVTNHHVLTFEDADLGEPRGEADDLQVTLADGHIYKAVVIGRSLTLDIAVLHVFAPLGAMKPLPIGTSRDLQVGQDVTAIGNPFGLDHTLTAGVISALGRDLLTSFNTHITGAIQTDAAINPGNSGGPLLDRAGRLVGMNTAITTNSGANTGVGFAIPVDTLNTVVPLLIAKGQTYRPTLGFDTLKDTLLAAFGVRRGAAVRQVTPGGIADRAGLRPMQVKPGVTQVQKVEDVTLGDLIVGVNGTAIDSDIQLMDHLELLPPEQPLEFDLIRDGKHLKITLKPGEAPPPHPAGPEQKT